MDRAPDRQIEPASGTRIRVLILEDNPSDADLMVDALRLAGLDPQWERVDLQADFEARLTPEPDLILSDYSLPQFNGVQALQLVRSRGLDMPFILVSGSIGEDIAVEAMRNGADDYLLKDRMARLGPAVVRALEMRRARAEQRRTAAERAQLATIVESANDAILSVDRANRILTWNPMAERLFGWSAAEARGQTINLLYPPDEQDRVQANLAAAIEATGQRHYEARRRARDGRLLDLLVSTFLIRDDGGNVAAVGVSYRDISARRKAEGEHAQLAAIVDNSNDAIISRSLDRKILTWNPAAERLFGWTAQEAIGQSVSLFIPPERASESARNQALVQANQPVPAYDTVRRARDGRHIDVSLSHSPIRNERGEVTAVSLAFRDVTERKLAEKKIRHLNRVYAVLSGINTTIVRVKDHRELFSEACRIAVEHGSFEIAWIGILDPATQDVTPVAWTGEGSEDLTRGKSSAREDTPRGKGAVGRAIRERRPVFNNDITADNSGGARLKEILRLGFKSQITLPLYENQAVVAVLTMYAREPNFFDKEELKLLTELAGDISFALENISNQNKIEKLSRIRAVLGAINAAIVRIHSKRELFEEACRIAVEAGRFPFAWLGLVDREANEVRPVAWAGTESGFLSTMQGRRTLDARTRQGPTISARAVLEKEAVIVNDVQNDPRVFLKKEHLERNINSITMLPLLVAGEPVGVLSLHAAEIGFFDEEEMKLLNELAGDIAFALQAIEKQEKLDYLSYYDPLTGLPNRTLYLERLGRCLAAAGAGEQVVVMLGDIQRLRMINETLGRQAGDEVLRQVAKRLADVVRNPESVARISADWFATFMPNVRDIGEAAHRIEQIRLEFLRNPFPVAGRELTLAYTLGAVIYPADGKDAESLLANAEAALKKAKATGESLLFYEPSINAQVAESLGLENKLRRALEKEQFVLHYQPKIELASGRICGLEALIRWNDPETGLVPPVKFIPLLEETGMILDAGRWAMHQALRDYREWTGRGLQPPRIAVNVSPIQLRQKDFVEVVRGEIGSAAGSHGLDLEITESLIMEDIAGNIEKLRAIQDMGVKIAIDDFGTGYSSLGYLAKLPVNALKIDRSFIITMAKDPDSMTIVSAVISLAHSLNLTVVAEGVDSEEQRKILRLLRCDEAQGYLFSKPLPAEQLAELLSSSTARGITA